MTCEMQTVFFDCSYNAGRVNVVKFFFVINSFFITVRDAQEETIIRKLSGNRSFRLMFCVVMFLK